jgi:hypothetical protein
MGIKPPKCNHHVQDLLLIHMSILAVGIDEWTLWSAAAGPDLLLRRPLLPLFSHPCGAPKAAWFLHTKPCILDLAACRRLAPIAASDNHVIADVPSSRYHSCWCDRSEPLSPNFHVPSATCVRCSARHSRCCRSPLPCLPARVSHRPMSLAC